MGYNQLSSQKPPVSKDNPIGVGTFRISEKAIEYVNDVLRSERLSYGPYSQKFESEFARLHDCRFSVFTNSGTSCLMIAVAALKSHYGWSDGDEVLVPAVTFVATANVIIQLNLKPVFVDVDPIHYHLDPSKLEAALTKRTRAIIPVHLFGSPCDMGPIMEFANRHQLKVIEDSCETMFTRYEGKSVGSFGDIGCFSTYIAHILSTGVGGLCTTNDPDLAITLRSLMNHGRDSIYLSIDDDKGKSEQQLSIIAQKRFSFMQLGYSFRCTEMESALGVAALECYEPMMRARRENARNLLASLSDLESVVQLPTIRQNAEHAFMMFPIVLRNESKRKLVDFFESRGIETRDMLPLVNQPVYQSLLGTRESDFPVAQWINRNGFYFGCHQDLTDADISYISDCLHQYCKGRSTRPVRSSLIVLSKVSRGADELSLCRTAKELHDGPFDEFILADASSDTKAAEIFSKTGFKVVSGPSGKGELLTKAVNESQSEQFVVMGVDGTDNFDDAGRLLIRLRQGADLVVATRFIPGSLRENDHAYSFHSIGNRFFTLLLSVIFRSNVTDGLNLFRAFTKEAFLKWKIESRGDGVMYEMTAKALANRFQYVEQPTFERKPRVLHRKANRLVKAFQCLAALFVSWRTMNGGRHAN